MQNNYALFDKLAGKRNANVLENSKQIYKYILIVGFSIVHFH
jgi:hypothetical protein